MNHDDTYRYFIIPTRDAFAHVSSNMVTQQKKIFLNTLNITSNFN